MFDKDFVDVYLYTFKEIRDYYIEKQIEYGGIAPFNFDTIQKLSYGNDFISGDTLTQVEDIFSLALIKFENWYCFKSYEKLELTRDDIIILVSHRLRDLGRRLKLWYYATYDNYKTLLTEYNDLKNKLINNIESTQHSEGKHNDYDDDTPQTKIVDSHNIFDKEHASYYRYGDNDADITNNVNNQYNIEKLEMLKNRMFDVKDEWATTLKDYLISAEYDEYKEV